MTDASGNQSDQNDNKTVVDQLNEMLNQFDSISEERLDTLNNLAGLRQVMLSSEAQRLARKLGADHPRVQKAQARAEQNAQFGQAIQAKIANLRNVVETPNSDEVILYGRVTDENLRGVRDVEVVILDKKGAVQETVGTAKSDDSGFYQVTLEKATLTQLKDLKDYKIAFRTSQGNVIGETASLSAIPAGERVKVDMVVPLSGLMVRPAPSPAAAGDEYHAAGVVQDKDGKPAPGLMVNLFALSGRDAIRLGVSLTDANGKFDISYAPGTLPEGDAAIFVTVIDERGKQLRSTRNEPHKTPGALEEFDITLG
jgi:5-hydroxyisourate hydrolase-like protein (transthyretin family)